MGSSLDRITDWPGRAAQARWCVLTLARNCNVSVSTLERHIRKEFGLCPRDWLLQMRMEYAVELRKQKLNVNEIAAELHYKNPQHFSRSFKQYFGHPPSQHGI